MVTHDSFYAAAPLELGRMPKALEGSLAAEYASAGLSTWTCRGPNPTEYLSRYSDRQHSAEHDNPLTIDSNP
jgi:hypothetical protein